MKERGVPVGGVGEAAAVGHLHVIAARLVAGARASLGDDRTVLISGGDRGRRRFGLPGAGARRGREVLDAVDLLGVEDDVVTHGDVQDVRAVVVAFDALPGCPGLCGLLVAHAPARVRPLDDRHAVGAAAHTRATVPGLLEGQPPRRLVAGERELQEVPDALTPAGGARGACPQPPPGSRPAKPWAASGGVVPAA